VAELILHPDPQSFPPGTAVKVYETPVPPAGGQRSGKPPGAQLSEPVVAAAGTLTVTGLVEGVRYVGWAVTGGVDRYLTFALDAASSTGGGGGAAPGPWLGGALATGNGVSNPGGPGIGHRLESGGAMLRMRGLVKATSALTANTRIATLAYPGNGPKQQKEIIVPMAPGGSVSVLIETEAEPRVFVREAVPINSIIDFNNIDLPNE
jgi:hypothetical protein